MGAGLSMPEMPRSLLCSCGLALVAILVGGLWFYRVEESRLREDAERQLAAIVKLKAAALSDWRQNARADAAHVAENPWLVAALTRGLAGLPPAEGAALRAWLVSFCKHGQYSDVLLTDAAGQLQFSLARLPRTVAPEERDALRQALQTGVPQFSSFFRPGEGQGPRLSVVTRLRTPTTTHGVLLVADPQTFIFPLLQSWPLPSRSAETLLVQREGDAVLFLNELRHQSNTLSPLRIPLTHTEVPAVQAVLGRQGVVPGVDYRGVSVLSALAAVPAAPWFLVGKEDEAEALAAWRLQSCLIFVLIGVLLLGMVGAGWLTWQQLQQRHYRAAYLAEREAEGLRQRHAQLIRHANDIIVLSDAGRHIIEANHCAQEAYGYTRAEMLGLPVARLIPAAEQVAFETRMRELETRGEFRSEGLHQRKDGSLFPVEMSACVIAVEGGQITQTITRDITERRAHLAEIERMNRLYVALSQVNQSIVRAHTREELFAEMCRVLIDFGGFKLAWIGLVNPATQQVELAGRHGAEDQLLDGVQVFASDRPEGRGTVGPAIRENRPVVVADFMGDERTRPWRDFGARAGVGSVAALPLHREGQACGALVVYAGERDFFHERELALLTEAALDISYAMDALHAADSRRRAEEALQASGAQFQALFDSMQEMVVMHELVLDAAGQPVDYRLLSCNPAFTAITGLTAAQAEGALGSALYGTGQPPYLEAYARAVRTGQPENFEAYFAPLRKHFSVSAFRYAPGRFATVTLDSTERKGAEQALRANERMYRNLFDNMLNGFAYCRMLYEQGQPQDFIYLAVNEAFVRHTGLNNVVGKKVSEVIPGIRAADPELFACYGRVALTGQPEHSEMYVKSLQLWFSISVYCPEPEHFVVVFDVITERKRAEAALLASEEKYRLLIENAHEAIYVVQAGVIQFANRAAAELAGRDVLQVSILDLILPEDRSAVLQHHQELLAGAVQVSQREYRLLVAGGAVRWLVVNAVRIVWQGQPATLNFASDITARKQAEEKLRESEELFQSLVENLQQFVFRKDAQGRFTFANRVFCTSVGRPLAGILGKTDADFFPPHLVAKYQADDQRVLLTGASVEDEEPHIQPDGTRRDMHILKTPLRDAAGGIMGLQGIAWDITAHKAAEAALQRVQEDWAHIFQAIGQPTAILDPRHGLIAANQALMQASGKTLDELRGLKCWQIFHDPQTREAVATCPMETALSSGRRESTDLEVQLFGGSYLVSCTPVRNAAGQVEKVIHIATDITEIKRLRQDILQAQKMETVGKLAGGVAHDFNNILQSILGYSELLLSQTPPDDERHRDLLEIQRNGERAAGLTRQLLAFSRKQMLLPRVHELNDIVTNLSRLLSRVIGEDVQLELDLQAGSQRVKVDVGQIEQVLMNLAVNARDAMSKGGRLVIRTRRITLAPEDLPLHPEGRAGAFACIEVVDNGDGMSPEVQARIFEPFFTTKPQGKGTGLGLATVHGIIKQHEGWTTVYSERGLGTTFKIHLPAVADEGEAAPLDQEEPAPTGHNEAILLLEDEPNVRGLAHLMLSRNGYRVTDASTCTEALAAYGDQFDLVLSDMVLPDGNGLEMARHFQHQRPDLRCVLTSGYADIHERWPEIAERGWVFLHKPFSQADLLRAIATALARA